MVIFRSKNNWPSERAIPSSTQSAKYRSTRQAKQVSTTTLIFLEKYISDIHLNLFKEFKGTCSLELVL